MRLWIQILFGLMTAISAGCSQVTWSMFQPVDPVPTDHAVVYLYFPIPKGQEGIKDRLTILANGMVLTRLDTQGYYPYVAPRGRITFAMEGWPEKGSVTIDTEPGSVHFVRVALIGRGMFIYNSYYQLEQVSADNALPEIKMLYLMESCATTQGCIGRNATR